MKVIYVKVTYPATWPNYLSVPLPLGRTEEGGTKDVLARLRKLSPLSRFSVIAKKEYGVIKAARQWMLTDGGRADEKQFKIDLVGAGLIEDTALIHAIGGTFGGLVDVVVNEGKQGFLIDPDQGTITEY